MKRLLEKLYNAIPLKGDLFSLIRIFRPPQRIYKHLHFKGEFWVRVPGGGFSMMHYGYELENGLYWRGIKGWEKQSLELWIKLSKRASYIYDVGANTGVYALVAAASNPKAQVYAFEPLKRVFEKLQVNAELNSRLKIKVYDLAISNTNGKAILYDDNAGEHSYSASLNPDHRKTGRGSTVQTKTLNSFLSENNLEIDLIKIDVERFEPQVIEGFVESIRKFQPSILIEVLDKEIGEQIEELIKDVPYLYYSIHEENGVRLVDHISKSDGFNYLICTEKVAREVGL